MPLFPRIIKTRTTLTIVSLLGVTPSSLLTTEESCKCEALITFQNTITSFLETLSTKHILLSHIIFSIATILDSSWIIFFYKSIGEWTSKQIDFLFNEVFGSGELNKGPFEYNCKLQCLYFSIHVKKLDVKQLNQCYLGLFSNFIYSTNVSSNSGICQLWSLVVLIH